MMTVTTNTQTFLPHEPGDGEQVASGVAHVTMGGSTVVIDYRFGWRLAGPADFRRHRSRWLRQLIDVALASGGYLPFRDNIDQAARHGARCIAHPANPDGSACVAEVQHACDEYQIALANTGIRLFRH